MLTALTPKIVGHFDLVRLKSGDHERELVNWKNVWEKVERNVEFIASYGGLVELNSAALRKGWKTPYPGKDVFEVWISFFFGKKLLQVFPHSLLEGFFDINLSLSCLTKYEIHFIPFPRKRMVG